MNTNEHESLKRLFGRNILSSNQSFPLELGMPKIQNNPDFVSRDFQIVEHLASFCIGYAFDYLCIHNDAAKCD